jgi:hypothetical protein
MNQIGGIVRAFRLLRNSTTKATDHELQKYDNFTRYGHTRPLVAARTDDCLLDRSRPAALTSANPSVKIEAPTIPRRSGLSLNSLPCWAALCLS